MHIELVHKYIINVRNESLSCFNIISTKHWVVKYRLKPVLRVGQLKKEVQFSIPIYIRDFSPSMKQSTFIIKHLDYKSLVVVINLK